MILPCLLANFLVLCGKFFPVVLTPKTNVACTTIASMRSNPEKWTYYSHYSEGNGVIYRGDNDSRCGICFTSSNAFHRIRHADQVNYPLGIWDMSLILIAKEELDATHRRMEQLTAQTRITAALGDVKPPQTPPMLPKPKAPKQLL